MKNASEIRRDSDGCTGWFDGFWKDCCIEHDVAYAQGGSRGNRRFHDRVLRECVYVTVRDRTESPLLGSLMAWSMYFGVRIMGSPWCLPMWLWPKWRKKARWGYEKDKW